MKYLVDLKTIKPNEKNSKYDKYFIEVFIDGKLVSCKEEADLPHLKSGIKLCLMYLPEGNITVFVNNVQVL